MTARGDDLPSAKAVNAHAVRFCTAARVLARGDEGDYLAIWFPTDQPRSITEENLFGAVLVGSSLCGGILSAYSLAAGARFTLTTIANALGVDSAQVGFRCLEVGIKRDFYSALRVAEDQRAIYGIAGVFKVVDYLQTTFVQLGGHRFPIPEGGWIEWGTNGQ